MQNSLNKSLFLPFSVLVFPMLTITSLFSSQRSLRGLSGAVLRADRYPPRAGSVFVDENSSTV